MSSVAPRFQVILVRDSETDRRPLAELVLELAEHWSFTDEPYAEGIRRVLAFIERHGPRGDIVRSGLVELFEATCGVYRIAHAPSPHNPQIIYAVSAYLEDDAEEGRAQAWALLLRAVGLIPGAARTAQ